MVRQTAAEKALARITAYLFYNPWSTTREIAALSGLPLWRVQETIVDFPRAIERLSIPWSRDDQRAHALVHAPTSWAQRRYVGRFRSPKLLASALLMRDQRLAFTRELLMKISAAGSLYWSISPWNARRKGVLFDAIASLSAGPNRAILGVFAHPPHFASLPWYEQAVSDWVAWREKSGNVQPANLYICKPTLENQTVKTYLTRKIKESHGNIIIFTNKPDQGTLPGWHSLTQNPLTAVPEVLLSPEGFAHIGIANHPYPGAAQQRTWAERRREEEELGQQVLALLQLSTPEISALTQVGLHPPATINRLRASSGTLRERNQMHAQVRRLENLGLVETHRDSQSTVTITTAGISLLGCLAGVTPELTDELLGWPNRPTTYSRQEAHYQRIYSFLLWLHQAGRAEDWSTMKCRYRFREISVGPVRRKIVTIHPDGEGDFIFSDGRRMRFWLEVDRGTRTGRRFSAQLEKYYLIRYARVSPINIPLLLYITDTGDGQDEGRLRSAARRLTEQGRRRYPRSRLQVLFTTGDLIDRFADADPGRVPIWRRFSGGYLQTTLLSLEDGILQFEVADENALHA
jgi:DNA-binding MarR family transcriptional regulator